jgi:hypothetical protein
MTAAMRSADDAIRALREHGFLAMKGPSDSLVPYTVIFTRAWEAPFMDAVHLRAEHDATAARARIDHQSSLACLFAEDNNDDPWPGEEWWKSEFVDVVAKLLALTPPSKSGQPTALAMTPGGLWVPGNRSELLRATM